jgi:branched-chain amino acid uptake carrier
MINKSKNDFLTIGFALFAMFFGAGNLIFPPYLGMESGSKWLLGFICFIIIDIGLSMLGIFAIARLGKGAAGITERLGGKVSLLILAANCICIGPLIAIPRTASITYEIGLAPNFPGLSSWTASAIFFAIVIVLSIRQTKAVDVIGKFMAPLMFIALMVMIIKGIISPIGSITSGSAAGTIVRDGLLSGYQTMDMMGSMIFSVAIIISAKDKGYETKTQQFSIISKAGALSAVLLAAVYGGLTYMGAMMSSADVSGLTQTQLLLLITDKLMGKPGLALLGVIVAFACLTTAIGILTSIASFFAEKTKIRYEYLVIGLALFSMVVSNFGTATIISMAAPVLNLIYPVLIIMIIMSFFTEKIASDGVFKAAALGAFTASAELMLESYFHFSLLTAILPLAKVGFGWIIPAAVFGGFAALVALRRKSSKETD